MDECGYRRSRKAASLTAVIKSFLCILEVTTRPGGLFHVCAIEVGMELPAGPRRSCMFVLFAALRGALVTARPAARLC